MKNTLSQPRGLSDSYKEALQIPDLKTRLRVEACLCNREVYDITDPLGAMRAEMSFIIHRYFDKSVFSAMHSGDREKVRRAYDVVRTGRQKFNNDVEVKSESLYDMFLGYHRYQSMYPFYNLEEFYEIGTNLLVYMGRYAEILEEKLANVLAVNDETDFRREASMMGGFIYINQPKDTLQEYSHGLGGAIPRELYNSQDYFQGHLRQGEKLPFQIRFEHARGEEIVFENTGNMSPERLKEIEAIYKQEKFQIRWQERNEREIERQKKEERERKRAEHAKKINQIGKRYEHYHGPMTKDESLTCGTAWVDPDEEIPF